MPTFGVLDVFTIPPPGAVSRAKAIPIHASASTKSSLRPFGNFKTSSPFSYIGDIYFGIRPEHLTIDKEGPIKAVVEFIELIGSNTLIHCRLQATNEVIVVSAPGIIEEDLSRKEIGLNFDQSKIHLFDQKNNMRIN